MKYSSIGSRKRPFLHPLAKVLLTTALSGLWVACGQSPVSNPKPPATSETDVTVSLENIDSSAWTVTAVEGAEMVTERGIEDPVINLEVGKRYRFVNNGSLTFHPFAIRGKDGEPVLGQRANDRPFELDPNVAFKADEQGITFTLTEALAAVVSTYYCTAHPTPLMEGKLEVAGASH